MGNELKRTYSCSDKSPENFCGDEFYKVGIELTTPDEDTVGYFTLKVKMEKPIPAVFVIFGSVVGGVIFLIFLTVIIFTCRRHQQIERELDGDYEQEPIVTSAAIVTHHPPPPLIYGTTNPGFDQNNTTPYPYPGDVQNNPYPAGYNNQTSYPTNQGAQYPGYQTNYVQI